MFISVGHNTTKQNLEKSTKQTEMLKQMLKQTQVIAAATTAAASLSLRTEGSGAALWQKCVKQRTMTLTI